MARTRSHIALLIAFALSLAACTPQPAAPTETEPSPTIQEATGGVFTERLFVVGDIDARDPVTLMDVYQPFADYLAENLAAYGITGGEVKIAPDLATMAAWMKNGEVDLYFDSMYPAMIVADASGAMPILRRWRGGDPVYHTVLFGIADQGLESAEDLKGQIIAFDTIYSTSGYLLPLTYLLEQGLDPVEVTSPTTPVAADQVGYIFSENDDNTIGWVLSGIVAAGATDNQTYEGSIPEETRKNLVILAETQDVPRQVVLVRAGLEPEITSIITSLLIALSDTPEGDQMLERLRTTRFDEFPNGPETALNEMRELYLQVKDR